MKMELNLDETNFNRLTNFFKFYEFETMIGDTEKKFFLGEKKTPQTCRFCDRSEPEVTFNSDAHVMPQFMGNKHLLSLFECDSCNALFSKYEASFSNFLGVSRTFSQIKGKTNKIPQFKDSKSGLEVKVTDEGIMMSITDGFDAVILNNDTKTLEITTERPGYVPIHITKLLIKLGLSMLPEVDVKNYAIAKKFILNSNNDKLFQNSQMLGISGYFIPGPPSFPTPFVQLYKRKDAYKDSLLPERQVILYYSNNYFQIILPFAESDKHLQGQSIDLPIFPLLIDQSYFEQFGKYQQYRLLMTNDQKVSRQEHKLTFAFDTMTGGMI